MKKEKREKNSAKNIVRRLWARSRANKDNASGQGSKVNNERKSRAAVKSVTATKRTDLKAAQTRSDPKVEATEGISHHHESSWTWTEAAGGSCGLI